MSNKISNSSRAWFFPTSPRSPNKLQGELALLKQLDGQLWNNDTQIKFARLLEAHPNFAGNISKSNPAFSARDRATRAPRLLGFVHFPKKGTKGNLQFTEVGNLFIKASTEECALIYQRQLSKVQFSSPLHNTGGFEKMSVKPLLVMIKLLLELKSMSKFEVALFGCTLVREEQFTSHLRRIKVYRKQLTQQTNAREKKLFRQNFASEWVGQIYSEDVALGNTHLREGGTDFVKTKLQTLKDYADSTIRYLRATGLFTVSPHGQRLMLLNSNIEDAKYLLEQYGIGLSSFSSLAYDNYVTEYLGNPSQPLIRKDNPDLQKADLNDKLTELRKHNAEEADKFSKKFIELNTNIERLQALEQLQNTLAVIQIKNEATSLRTNQKTSLSDIKRTYSEISNKSADIIDRPLMYEWNAWRAMVLINDATNVLGNYTTDYDGNPVSTAGGNKPDIQVEYDRFHLIVEVTLSSGHKQYQMEGESITRHLGLIQKHLNEIGDSRPIFGIFVAESVNPTVNAHLYLQANLKIDLYHGTVRIIPMTRLTFEKFMESALAHPAFNHQVLLSFFETVFSKEALANGENHWLSLINDRLNYFSHLQEFQAS